MDVLAAVVTFVVALGGVGLGAVLSRRNERRAQADRLLVEALNDAVDALAAVAAAQRRLRPEMEFREDRDRLDAAQHRYASAVSRVALHGSPSVCGGVPSLPRRRDDRDGGGPWATDRGGAEGASRAGP